MDNGSVEVCPDKSCPGNLVGGKSSHNPISVLREQCATELPFCCRIVDLSDNRAVLNDLKRVVIFDKNSASLLDTEACWWHPGRGWIVQVGFVSTKSQCEVLVLVRGGDTTTLAGAVSVASYISR